MYAKDAVRCLPAGAPTGPWRWGTDALVRRANPPDVLRLLHAAEFGGGDGVRRAEGCGRAPAAVGPVPGRAQGPSAADGRHRQAPVQGGAAPGGGGPAA